MKKKHPVIRVLVIILVALFVICGFVIAFQWKNIKALYQATQYSPDEIKQQISDNRKAVTDSLKSYNAPEIRDFTPEEEESIRKGELSVSEAMSKILEESDVSIEGVGSSDGNPANSALLSDAVDTENMQNGDNAANSAQSGSEGTTAVYENVDPVAQTVVTYTTKMYELKAQYLGQIGSTIDAAKADYMSGMSKTALASKYLSIVGNLETTADSEVESTLNELTAKLDSLGADTSIVNVLRQTYENEKSLKKSYYISLYEEKTK